MYELCGSEVDKMIHVETKRSNICFVMLSIVQFLLPQHHEIIEFFKY